MDELPNVPPLEARAAEPELDPRDASTAWRWTAFLLAPVIWCAPAAVLCVMVAAVTGLLWVPFGIALSPFATLVIFFLISRARDRSRSRNGKTILAYVETAVRLNLPLPAFLIAAEQSETGRRRAQLRTLREHLEGGWSVTASLGAVADLPENVVRSLAAHEAIGQLQVALTRMAERERQEAEQKHERPEEDVYRYYPLFVFVLILSAFMFLMIFILPKFNEIFKDFKTPLPTATLRVFSFFQFIADSPLLLIPLMMLVAVAIIMPLSLFMQRVFLPSWPEPKFAEVWAWIRWRLPVFRGLERDAGMAASCDLLSEALAAGVPLPIAARSAAELPVNPGLRARLKEFYVRLERGEPSAAAAQGARLPALVAGVLGPLSVAGVNASGSAMFSFLSRYYRQKFSRALVFLQAAFGPLAVLLMGAMVLAVLYAVISALAALIQSVMDAPRNVL